MQEKQPSIRYLLVLTNHNAEPYSMCGARPVKLSTNSSVQRRGKLLPVCNM